MKRRKFLSYTRLIIIAVLALAWGVNQGYAQNQNNDKNLKLRGGKLTAAERKAAAKRAAAKGLKPGVAGVAAAPVAKAAPGTKAARGTKAAPVANAAPGVNAARFAIAPPLPGIEGPGGVPHYFGPYANWAFSPLPTGSIGTIAIDAGGTGYTAPTVAILDAYGTVDVLATATINPATQIDPATGAITGITVTNAGSGYSAPIVEITDPMGVDAAATAILTGLTGGMRKFVDRIPGLGPAGANNIIQAHGAGQYIPVAVPQNRTFSGQAADYYEIALVEFSEKLHSDLPPTRLRGYVQLSTTGTGIALINIDGTPILKPDGTPALALDHPHYLGPLIIAQGRVHGVANTLPTDPGYPKPVRVKFYNLLPAGAGGNLFIPVDETIPGGGIGPAR
jgi:hypothetical protein